MTIRTEVVDDKACYDGTAMTICTEVVYDNACYDGTYGGSRR